MKIITSLLVVLALSSASVHAQNGTVGNNTLAGAVLGGIAGAVVGNNSRGHDSAKGALIGVAAGGLIGAVVGQQKVISRSQGIIPQPEYSNAQYPANQTANPYAWEPSQPSPRGQWVACPPDQPRSHYGERTVIVVKTDPFAELDTRLAQARDEAQAAHRNAASLQRALEQAQQAAYAAEQRANELARIRRGYATNGYR